MNISLILVLVAGLIPLFFFLVLRNKKSSLICITLKTLSSIFFIAIALLAINSNLKNINKYPNNIIAVLTIIGLLFGLFGDFTLDFKIYFASLRGEYKNAIKDSDIMTYIGMGAFFVGHVMYITSLTLKYPTMWSLYSMFIAIALAFVVVIVGGKLSNLEYGKWKVPALSYCSMLCWFGVLSVIVTIKDSNTSNILRMIGSLTFLASDLFLSITYFCKDDARNKEGFFNPEGRFFIISNHAIYYVAQYLIAFSLLYLA